MAQRRLILVVVIIIVVVTDTVSIEELLARIIEVIDETHQDGIILLELCLLFGRTTEAIETHLDEGLVAVLHQSFPAIEDLIESLEHTIITIIGTERSSLLSQALEIFDPLQANPLSAVVILGIHRIIHLRHLVETIVGEANELVVVLDGVVILTLGIVDALIGLPATLGLFTTESSLHLLLHLFHLLLDSFGRVISPEKPLKLLKKVHHF